MKPVFSSLRSFFGKPSCSVRMYLPIALVAFALCFPAPAAADITLEQPVSDITLVLNEAVTIQFPQGTTDSTETGKWKYRILKNPRLPKGLTFEQATRTLSGTPVKKHDATHSYRIRYVWGREEADQEKLVVPFRLVVKKPDPIAVKITPERPVSDITLVLNETVTILFPGGTTNSIKENGKWKYRIVKNPRLPKGLTFDQDTRTLSGTPVKEHDAIHSYRIRYVWGRKEADQGKLVVPFRLVVKKPPPIAVKITPKRPVSDITLELNKAVSIQFPDGTVDRPQENGKWKYRIVENPRLPKGLTFNQDTRTLSGTPVKEHDAIHSYRIRYVWGREEADQGKLVVPFRLVVKKPDPIAARIRDFIGEASSVGEFAKGLPDLHKIHSLHMVASQALDGAFVSEKHPRMLSFGANARTIFAWGSDSDSDRYDTVEFIAAGERRWHFGVIDFAEDPPVVTRDPEECQSCHNGHPLWAEPPAWPGTLYEITVSSDKRDWVRVQPVSYYHALYQGFMESSDPRISTLVGPSDPRISTIGRDRFLFISLTHMTDELANQLAIRHGELLAKEVIAQSEDDFYETAKKLACERNAVSVATVRSHWPREVLDLSRMGKGGELVLLRPDWIYPTSPGYDSGNAVLEHIIILLIFNHLYEIDSEIQAIYDRTSNTDITSDLKYLHYGTVTAADELRSRVDLVKLAGQASIDKRRALGRVHFDMAYLDRAHLNEMIPKICKVLRARDTD